MFPKLTESKQFKKDLQSFKFNKSEGNSDSQPKENLYYVTYITSDTSSS